MTPTCHNFQQTNIQGGGICRIGVPGGTGKKPIAPPEQPAYRTCARCEWWKGPGQSAFKESMTGVSVTAQTAMVGA